MQSLTLGKLRHLQQISNEFGMFTIAALDHRGSFEAMLAKTLNTSQLSWEAVVQEKERLTRALAPHASAVLLDPLYGLGPIIVRGLIPQHVGLLAALEESGYTEDASGWNTSLMENWTVADIKRLGASAIKLLLYYHPEAGNAARQEAILSQVAEACRQYDIPLFVEPICFPIEPGQKKTSPEFAARRPEIVIESAKRLVPLGVDVLKAEFPTEASYEPHQDEAIMRDYCCQLSEAIDIPWVLLSAGVDFATFQKQVEIACEAGASGFLAGRAIWKEYLSLSTPADRYHFLNTVAASRIRILSDIVNYRGTPWRERIPDEKLPTLREGWYAEY